MDQRTIERIPELLPIATRVVYNKTQRTVTITTADGEESFRECQQAGLESLFRRTALPYKPRIHYGTLLITVTRNVRRETELVSQ